MTKAGAHTPTVMNTPDAGMRAHPSAVRPLRAEDREPIIQLVRETGVFSDGEVAIALELIDVTLNRPDQEDYIIFTYDADDGDVQGYYCIGPTPGTEGTFDLYWIAVRPSAQGTGVGAALEAHAEAVARSRGGRMIVAETSSQPLYDRTRLFYARMGFAELARIPDYYKPGDDLVVYGKKL